MSNICQNLLSGNYADYDLLLLVAMVMVTTVVHEEDEQSGLAMSQVRMFRLAPMSRQEECQ